MIKRIYLILEVKSRELDSRILFSILAAKKNYSVVICKKAYLFSKLKYLKPGVVILKSMGKKNNSMISEARKYGHKICLMDEEGLLFWTPEIYCRKRIDEKVINLIEYIFTWGKNDFNAIVEVFPKHKNKLIITGNPRIDLLKKKYNNFYFAEAQKIKEKQKKFILINTNFGYANHITHPGQTIIEGIKRSGVENSDEISFHINKLETQIIRFEKLKKFIKKFAVENKEYKIIIRPHQSEDDQIWQQIFKNCENVEIIRDGKASISWMLASELIISCNCTTGVESKILGLNSLNFIPGDNAFSDYDLPNKVNQNIFNLEELITRVKDILNKKELDEVNHNDNVISYYVNNLKKDTLNSTEIILESIDHLFNDLMETKDKYSNYFSLKYFYIKRSLINLYMKRNYEKNKFSKLLLQKNPGTSIYEIKDKINQISSKNNIIVPKVKEIYPDVYCIKPHNI